VLSEPNWKLKALGVVLVMSLFRAFPSYDAFRTEFVQMTWRHAQAKVDDPLLDTGRTFPPESHESKLTFRLTVPVLAHVLRLRLTGTMIVFGLAGIALLYSVLKIAHLATGSRKVALFVSLATACTWPGLAAFHELRGGYYDAFALCLLLLALSASSPLSTAMLVFLAAWTDERALIASPFIAFFAMTKDSNGLRSFLLGKPGAVVAAFVAYAGTRAYLTAAHSLVFTTGGVGPAVLRQQLNVIPLGIWTGLGGGWLIVGRSFLELWGQKRGVLTAGFLSLLGLMIIGSLSVIDVTRSMAYCLPAVLVGLRVLSQSQPAKNIERLAALSAAVSFIAPTYYIEGSMGRWWLYPLPVQLVRWLS